MKVATDLSEEELISFVQRGKDDLKITVTATLAEFEKLFNTLQNGKLRVEGVITEFQADNFPPLLTIKSGDSELTFTVFSDFNAQVGDFIKVYADLKPKYRGGEFFYELRLADYILGGK